MIVLLLVIVAGYLFLKWLNSGNDSSSSVPREKSPASFPDDIYQTIETFAGLCSRCKSATGWAYELDHATICVEEHEHGVRLELTCRGDSIACHLPDEYRWLNNDGDLNEIKYVTDHAAGYVRENYGTRKKPTEADSLFYFYQKGDPHAIGSMLEVSNNGAKVFMLIDLR